MGTMGSGTCCGNRPVHHPRHLSCLASLGVVQESARQRARQEESGHPSAHLHLSVPRRYRRHTHSRHRRPQFYDRPLTLYIRTTADPPFPLAYCQEMEGVSKIKSKGRSSIFANNSKNVCHIHRGVEENSYICGDKRLIYGRNEQLQTAKHSERQTYAVGVYE